LSRGSAPLIVIAGPTATGKTDFSLKLAERIGGEIISADSMQVYKGLDVGTDKVSREVREKIPHHLIDVVEPTEKFSVADFVREAESALKGIRERGKVPIVVGGTSFYIKSFLYGLPQTPPSDEEIRKELSKLSNEALYQELLKVSPRYAKKVGKRDRKRLIRALEVYKLSGKSIEEFKIWESEPRHRFVGIFLHRDREELFKRIEDRVERQVKNGLLEETEWLLSLGSVPTALQALGYKEMALYLKGEVSLEEAKKILKKRTKEFAKRQFTWFKKEEGFSWFNLSDTDEEKLLEKIEEELGRRENAL